MKHPRLVIAACAAFAVAVCAGLAAGGFWTPWASAKYVQGVDVSWHQGAIDWQKLANTDVKFAYIKASEGGDHRDPRFAENWTGAAKAGLYRGAYHYFTICKSGSEQARNFVAAMRPDPAALPPAVDLEHMGPCYKGERIADIPGEVRTFLDTVQSRTGKRPLLYVTRQFHDANLTGFTGERFWVRSLFSAPQFRRSEWVIWQHHNKAMRDGVNGPIDLNAFRGDTADLAAFAGGGLAAHLNPDSEKRS